MDFVFKEFFFIRDFISQLVLLDSILAGFMFLETCQFLIACPICWYITVHSTLLCIYVVLVANFPLEFILFNWIVSLFLLDKLAKGL